MTLAVEDDFTAFVAARWPELEGLALVTTLVPADAREATTHALGRLRSEWSDALDDGSPTLRARRAVLGRSLHVAGSAGHRGPTYAPPRPGALRPNGYDQGDLGGRMELDATVADALWQCLVRATPPERAVLACLLVGDLDLGESAHLLGMPVAEVEGHDRSLRGRLETAHEAGRAATGAPPAEWLLQDDLVALVDSLIEESPDPPDPAGLVAAEATGVRRRTLVLAGTAVLATTAAGWAVARIVGADDPSTASTPAIGPTSAVWDSTQQWPPRGGLANDVGVQGLILSQTSSGSRLVYADDVGDQRIVIAVPINIPSDPDGSEIRVWQGPRDALSDAMAEVEMPFSYIGGVNDVVAVHLPQEAGGSALVVLTRPTIASGQLSRFVIPTPGGTVERTWRALGLTDGVGVALSELALSPAMRVRVAEFDGTPASPSMPWLDVDLSDGLSDVADRVSDFISGATGDRPETLTTTVAADSITVGSILDAVAMSATGGDGRVVVLLTRTPSGGAIRSIFAADDGRTGGATQSLELAMLIPAAEVDDPTLVRLSDEGLERGRFLVVAPGGARAQLLATSPNAYPVSKVTNFKGDTAVVSVINADDAAAFRLIVHDATGRETYRGVPSTGEWLFDLGFDLGFG